MAGKGDESRKYWNKKATKHWFKTWEPCYFHTKKILRSISRNEDKSKRKVEMITGKDEIKRSKGITFQNSNQVHLKTWMKLFNSGA